MAFDKISRRLTAVLVLTISGLRLCHCLLSDGPAVWSYICIDEGKGHDSEKCLSNSCYNCSWPCKTLDYAFKGSRNFTSIEIVGTVHIAQVVGTARSLRGLNVTGTPGAILRCNGSSAGLRFSEVHNLTLSNVLIDRCGFAVSNHTAYRRSVFIEDCENAAISGVTVTNGSGAALLFYNTYGLVTISNSNFSDNPKNHTRYVGGAIRVLLQTTRDTLYEVSYCTFVNNFVTMRGKWESIKTPWYEQGGAVYVSMNKNASGNRVVVSSSEFIWNKAKFGGGVYVGYGGTVYNNSVELINCNFTQNWGYTKGGGVFIEYYNYNGSTPIYNTVTIRDCIFLSNSAGCGGGVAISATHSDLHSTKGSTIVFDNCVFQSNSAYFASTVDVSPDAKDTAASGLLLRPLFTNCIFRSNTLWGNFGIAKTSHVSSGTFLVTGFTVDFGGNIFFSNNNATPLQLVSATAIFSAGTNVSFFNNSATYGGALQLIGFSEVIVNDDSTFLFVNNCAGIYGGAIYYYTYDQHDYIISDTCFIHYGGFESISRRGLSFTFSGNKALSGEGNDIMASTFLPCFFSCTTLSSRNITSFFNACITRNFTYDARDPYALSTLASKFTNVPSHLYITPGNETSIDVTIENELHQQLSDVVYKVTLLTEGLGGTCALDSQYAYTFMRKTLIYGTHNQSGYIQLQTLGPTRIIETLISFTLLRCPPGFVNNNDTNSSQCVCNNNYEGGARGYLGIDKCEGNGNVYRAYITQGYWAGYLDPTNAQNDLTCDPRDNGCELYTTAPCPSGVCRYQLQDAAPGDGDSGYLLPTNSSELQEYICGPRYRGALCSTCQRNFSVYYHSYQFQCNSDDICDYGLIFYVLSELLPLTIIFVVLVTFNVNLTSGWSNGFILFAQLLQLLDVTLYGALKMDSTVTRMSMAYKVLYGFVSMSFFNLESLSFCLWRGAQVLDVIAFRYATTAYALALLIGLIFIMTNCSCPSRWRRWGVARSPTRSVIHGLTAYLVLCFAQYTQTTFLLLTPLRVFDGERQPSAVLFTMYGGLTYFGRGHLKYVVPACAFLVTFVLLPPLVLLLYPLHYKVLAALGLAESSIIRRITFFPDLKPYLDSLQGCFKDQFRFFSGLYFCYRLIPAILQMACPSTFQYYVAMELLLIIILLLHAVCQPYVSRWHNVVDTCLFADMTIINGITLYHHTMTISHAFHDNNVALSSIQATLIILPLIYMGGVIVCNTVCKRHLFLRCRYEKIGEGSMDTYNIQAEDTDTYYSASAED